jgi:hypothetical protein
VARGDLAISYASVWQAVFAVVEVTSDPEEDPKRERWRWSFAIRPLLALDDLDPVDAGGGGRHLPELDLAALLHQAQRGSVRVSARRDREGLCLIDTSALGNRIVREARRACD